jgi:hypothetical protein
MYTLISCTKHVMFYISYFYLSERVHVNILPTILPYFLDSFGGTCIPVLVPSLFMLHTELALPFLEPKVYFKSQIKFR